MKITQYIQETKAELKHVNWPTRAQTAIYTGLVIAISLVTAYFLGAFDHLFTLILQKII